MLSYNMKKRRAMKHTLIAAIVVGTALLSGCSDINNPEEAIDKSSGQINFYATAPQKSRAASTTTSTLQSFVVYGFTDTSVVMDGVSVSRDGGSWTYSPAVYWPASPVDFYAVSPDMRNNEGLQPDGPEVIKNVEYGSTDLLYAVTLDQIDTPAPVPLTFRHAMSRVAIMLSSTSEKYTIEVYHVSLNNISLSGNFELPNQDTSNATAQGTWSGLSKQAAALIYYDINGGFTTLTSTPKDITEGNIEASFFVPQTLEPLEFSSNSKFTGSFLQVDCIVRDKVTGTQIWPNKNTPKYLLLNQSESGRMVFPLSTSEVKSWLQGYSYVYNVVINSTYSVDTIQFSPIVKDYLQSQPY